MNNARDNYNKLSVDKVGHKKYTWEYHFNNSVYV